MTPSCLATPSSVVDEEGYSIMTRYAKLGGRKPQYSKSTAELANEAAPSAADAGSSRSAMLPARSVEVEASSEAHRIGAEGDQKTDDPSKLLKRAKLLKLKAKKATSEERKKSLMADVRSLEKRAQEANGKRGGGQNETKKKTGTGATINGHERTEASKGITNPWKAMEAERRAKTAERSTHRREKRAEERVASVRCFACRQMGHSARDCPESQANVEKGDLPIEATVVCCYRCGSTQHNLAKCRKPAPTSGSDLPFAHCFLCQKRGHLASKCDQNGGRGIYPLGGHCMLCKSVEHLAKDCPLNEAQRSGGSSAASTAAIGWIADMSDRRHGAGADEDDFHAMSRKRSHLDGDENGGKRKRRTADKNQKPTQRIISF